MRKMTLLVLCLLLALLLGGCAERASLGIIGGADGPTVVIVSGPDAAEPAE